MNRFFKTIEIIFDSFLTSVFKKPTESFDSKHNSPVNETIYSDFLIL